VPSRGASAGRSWFDGLTTSGQPLTLSLPAGRQAFEGLVVAYSPSQRSIGLRTFVRKGRDTRWPLRADS